MIEPNHNDKNVANLWLTKNKLESKDRYETLSIAFAEYRERVKEDIIQLIKNDI